MEAGENIKELTANFDESIRQQIVSYVRELEDKYLVEHALRGTSSREDGEKIAELKKAVDEKSLQIEGLNNCLDKTTTELKEAKATIEKLEKLVTTEDDSISRKLMLELQESRAECIALQRFLRLQEATLPYAQLERDPMITRLQQAIATWAEAEARNLKLHGENLDLLARNQKLEMEGKLLKNKIPALEKEVEAVMQQFFAARREASACRSKLEAALRQKSFELEFAERRRDQMESKFMELQAKYEVETKKIKSEAAMEFELQLSFNRDIELLKKELNLSEVLKSNAEAASKKMEKNIAEIRQCLTECVNEHQKSEIEKQILRQMYEEDITNKNSVIQVLKDELKVANKLLERLRKDDLEMNMTAMLAAACARGSGVRLTHVLLLLSQSMKSLKKKEIGSAKDIGALIRDIDKDVSTLDLIKKSYKEMQKNKHSGTREGEEELKPIEKFLEVVVKIVENMKSVFEELSQNAAAAHVLVDSPMSMQNGHNKEGIRSSEETLMNQGSAAGDAQEAETVNQCVGDAPKGNLGCVMKAPADSHLMGPPSASRQAMKTINFVREGVELVQDPSSIDKQVLKDKVVRLLMDEEAQNAAIHDFTSLESEQKVLQQQLRRSYIDRQIRDMPGTSKESDILEHCEEVSSFDSSVQEQNQGLACQVLRYEILLHRALQQLEAYMEKNDALQKSLMGADEIITSIQRELKHMEKEIDEQVWKLLGDLKYITAEKQKAQEEADCLAFQLSLLDSVEDNKQNNEMAEVRQGLESQLQLSKANCEMYRRQLESLDMSNTAKDKHIAQLEATIKHLQESLIDAQESLLKAQAALSAERERADELAMRVPVPDSTNGVFLSLHEEEVTNSKSLEHAEVQLEEAHMQDERIFSPEVAQFSHSVENKEKEELTRKKCELEKELRETRSALEQTQEELAHVSAARLEFEVAEDGEEVKSIQVQELARELSLKENELTATRDQLELAEQQVQEVQAIADLLETQLADTCTQYNELKDSSQKRAEEFLIVEASLKDKISTLEAQVVSLQSSLNKTSKNFQNAEQEIQMLELDVDEAKCSVVERERDVKASAYAAQAAEEKDPQMTDGNTEDIQMESMESVMKSNRLLRSEYDNLDSQLKEMHLRTENLEQEIFVLRAQKGERECRTDLLAIENASVKAEVINLRQRMQTLLSQLALYYPHDRVTLLQEQSALEAKISIDRNLFEQKEEELQKLHHDKHQLEKQVNSLRQQLSEISQEKRQGDETLFNTRELLMSSQEELSKLKLYLDKKMKELRKVTLELEITKEKAAQLVVRTRKYKAQVLEMQTASEDAQKKIKELESALLVAQGINSSDIIEKEQFAEPYMERLDSPPSEEFMSTSIQEGAEMSCVELERDQGESPVDKMEVIEGAPQQMSENLVREGETEVSQTKREQFMMEEHVIQADQPQERHEVVETIKTEGEIIVKEEVPEEGRGAEEDAMDERMVVVSEDKEAGEEDIKAAESGEKGLGGAEEGKKVDGREMVAIVEEEPEPKDDEKNTEEVAALNKERAQSEMQGVKERELDVMIVEEGHVKRAWFGAQEEAEKEVLITNKKDSEEKFEERKRERVARSVERADDERMGRFANEEFKEEDHVTEANAKHQVQVEGMENLMQGDIDAILRGMAQYEPVEEKLNDGECEGKITGTYQIAQEQEEVHLMIEDISYDLTADAKARISEMFGAEAEEDVHSEQMQVAEEIMPQEQKEQVQQLISSMEILNPLVYLKDIEEEDISDESEEMGDSEIQMEKTADEEATVKRLLRKRHHEVEAKEDKEQRIGKRILIQDDEREATSCEVGTSPHQEQEIQEQAEALEVFQGQGELDEAVVFDESCEVLPEGLESQLAAAFDKIDQGHPCEGLEDFDLQDPEVADEAVQEQLHQNEELLGQDEETGAIDGEDLQMGIHRSFHASLLPMGSRDGQMQGGDQEEQEQVQLEEKLVVPHPKGTEASKELPTVAVVRSIFQDGDQQVQKFEDGQQGQGSDMGDATESGEELLVDDDQEVPEQGLHANNGIGTVEIVDDDDQQVQELQDDEEQNTLDVTDEFSGSKAGQPVKNSGATMQPWEWDDDEEQDEEIASNSKELVDDGDQQLEEHGDGEEQDSSEGTVGSVSIVPIYRPRPRLMALPSNVKDDGEKQNADEAKPPEYFQSTDDEQEFEDAEMRPGSYEADESSGSETSRSIKSSGATKRPWEGDDDSEDDDECKKKPRHLINWSFDSEEDGISEEDSDCETIFLSD